MHNPRIACALIPNFSVVRLVRDDVSLLSRPLAVTVSDRDNSPIVAVSARASAFGVKPGMTAAQGESRCPDLKRVVRDVAAERAAAEVLVTALQQLGPHVAHAEDEPGLFFMEASGLTRLHHGESGLARKMLTTIAGYHYPVRVGVGANRFVARVAAEQARNNDYVIVPETAEQEFLSACRIDCLRPVEKTADLFATLGVTTVSQMATLSSHELVERFGAEGRTLAARSLGGDTDQFLPEQPHEVRTARMVFDESLHTSQEIIRAAEPLFEMVLAPLRAMQIGCTSAVIRFVDDNRRVVSRTLSVQRSTSATAVFLRQLRHQLERQPLVSGVVAMRVTIPQTTALVGAQLSLPKHDLQTQKHDGEKSDDASIMPSPLFMAVQDVATIPEKSFRLVPWTAQADRTSATHEESSGAVPAYCRRSPAGLRLFRPPRETGLRLAEGRVQMIQLGGVFQPVEKQAGPWMVSGDWWSDGFDRWYYELITPTHGAYLVFFDRRSSRWFLQGVFD